MGLCLRVVHSSVWAVFIQREENTYAKKETGAFPHKEQALLFVLPKKDDSLIWMETRNAEILCHKNKVELLQAVGDLMPTTGCVGGLKTSLHTFS